MCCIGRPLCIKQHRTAHTHLPTYLTNSTFSMRREKKSNFSIPKKAEIFFLSPDRLFLLCPFLVHVPPCSCKFFNASGIKVLLLLLLLLLRRWELEIFYNRAQPGKTITNLFSHKYFYFLIRFTTEQPNNNAVLIFPLS